MKAPTIQFGKYQVRYRQILYDDRYYIFYTKIENQWKELFRIASCQINSYGIRILPSWLVKIGVSGSFILDPRFIKWVKTKVQNHNKWLDRNLK